MIKTLKLLGLALLSACVGKTVGNTSSDKEIAKPTKSIYDYKLKTLDGNEITLEQFKGKYILLVNVASECGFTPQYEKLQKLHEQYGEKLAIIGVPANNFGSQEPGTDSQIGAFCKKNYGVTFTMLSKVSVKGNDICPLYQWLTQKELNGWNDKSPSWNFCKYLIGKDGQLLYFYNSATDPLSKDILDAIKD
ncbi:MAG: glutathione peroxidase [Cytophagales bacterium]